jgi:tetratricopeptide (TPR) repeat protein
LPEIASISYEGLARIAHKQKKLRIALEYAAKAVEINPKNLHALYDQARYLALMENTEEALEKLNELISNNEEYFLLMNLTPEFQQLDVQRLYEKLWDKKLIKNPIGLRQLLTSFLLLDDSKRAFSVFRYLADFHPKELLNPNVWVPQLFNKIEHQAKDYFQQLLLKGMSSGSQRYAKTLLFSRLNFPADDLLEVFLGELKDDPAFYEKDSGKIQRNLAANPPYDVKELIKKIIPIIPEEYDWLELERISHV